MTNHENFIRTLRFKQAIDAPTEHTHFDADVHIAPITKDTRENIGAVAIPAIRRIDPDTGFVTFEPPEQE